MKYGLEDNAERSRMIDPSTQGKCHDMLCTCILHDVLHDEQWEHNWLAGFLMGIAAGALLVHLLT